MHTLSIMTASKQYLPLIGDIHADLYRLARQEPIDRQSNAPAGVSD